MMIREADARMKRFEQANGGGISLNAWVTG